MIYRMSPEFGVLLSFSMIFFLFFIVYLCINYEELKCFNRNHDKLIESNDLNTSETKDDE
jgi:hypothetical protein